MVMDSVEVVLWFTLASIILITFLVGLFLFVYYIFEDGK